MRALLVFVRVLPRDARVPPQPCTDTSETPKNTSTVAAFARCVNCWTTRFLLTSRCHYRFGPIIAQRGCILGVDWGRNGDLSARRCGRSRNQLHFALQLGPCPSLLFLVLYQFCFGSCARSQERLGSISSKMNSKRVQQRTAVCSTVWSPCRASDINRPPFHNRKLAPLCGMRNAVEQQRTITLRVVVHLVLSIRTILDSYPETVHAQSAVAAALFLSTPNE